MAGLSKHEARRMRGDSRAFAGLPPYWRMRRARRRNFPAPYQRWYYFCFQYVRVAGNGVFHNATLIGGKNCALRFKRFEYQHIAPSHFSQMQPTFREPITDTAVSLK
jgi:hypothetical protein